MAAVSHGARHLKQGIGVPNLQGASRSIHIPAFAPRPAPPPPSTAQRIFSETRTFFSRFVSHLCTPGLSHSSFAASAQPALIRPVQFPHSQGSTSRFSLPVKHALARPFSAPRLPKPPAIPANVTQVGLGTARAFHSGRPIFQNMVDNVPVATRALWEAEWNLKVKKKGPRGMHRAARNKIVPKSQEMLKLKPATACNPSELDVYFPVQPTPAVTTHLLVPLAPFPTARLPLSARGNGSSAHALLPIADLASIHTNHRLHSLRVSTLFSRLDAANVWDDPGVNVDAYAFGPRHGPQDAQEKQCTVLRVTFRGWNTTRVRSVLGDSSEHWFSLAETNLDGRPTLDPLLDRHEEMHTNASSGSLSLSTVENGLACASEVGIDDEHIVPSPPLIRAGASAQHDLVFPTLDFSSAFSDAVDNLPPPPQPTMFLCTASELIRDAELAVQPSSSLSDSGASWECLSLDSSLAQRVREQ